MNANLKHMFEIAGGIVIGTLASKAVNGVTKITKTMVANKKAKESK